MNVYSFFMGRLLLYMPDQKVFDLSGLPDIELDVEKRFKIALELLENAKKVGMPVDKDIAFAKEFLGFMKSGISKNNNQSHIRRKEGCYIATCVYGSYDCPEVRSLRRYRDIFLKKHFLGRLFIRVYYTISPLLVSLFKNNNLFIKFWKSYLDRKIILLKKNGYLDSPYKDL